MRFVLVPHEGTAGVQFGMTRAEVRRVCGAPVRAFAKKEFFFDGALHVHYDGAGLAEYIVVARSLGGEGIFGDVDLLALDADAALALVRANAAVDDSHAEYPVTCIFPELDMDLWRSCLPAVSRGEEGRHFEAVAIGRAGFYG